MYIVVMIGCPCPTIRKAQGVCSQPELAFTVGSHHFVGDPFWLCIHVTSRVRLEFTKVFAKLLVSLTQVLDPLPGKGEVEAEPGH